MKINDIVVERAEDPRSEVKRREQFRTGGGTHKDRKKAVKRGEAKHKKQAVPMEGVAEAGRGFRGRSSWDSNMWSGDLGSRDRRSFKRREMEKELGHEDDPDFERKMRMSQDKGPWYLLIDGKIYKQKGQPKAFDWKKGANNYGLAIVKNKPELKGKVLLTKVPKDLDKSDSE